MYALKFKKKKTKPKVFVRDPSVEDFLKYIGRRPALILCHRALRRLILMFAHLRVVLMQRLIKC